MRTTDSSAVVEAAAVAEVEEIQCQCMPLLLMLNIGVTSSLVDWLISAVTMNYKYCLNFAAFRLQLYQETAMHTFGTRKTAVSYMSWC